MRDSIPPMLTSAAVPAALDFAKLASRHTRLALYGALLLVVSCGPRSGDATSLSGGDDPTTVANGSTSSGSDATSSGGSTSSATTSSATDVPTSSAVSSTGEPVIDVGLPSTGEGGSACNGKIDIMFIVSAAQLLDESLEASIPAFASTLEEELGEFDLHVMAVDPDGRWGSADCPKNKCPADGGCPLEGYEDYPCWALHEEGALTKCDDTRGAGVVFRAGPHSANKPCGVPPGQRYITRDTPDFAEVFSCLVRDGAGSGGIIMHGETLGRALAFDLQQGCNAGFLREDALLMVVQIVSASFGDSAPWEWADYVLEAKGGDQDMAVALAISRDWVGYPPGPLCEDGKTEQDVPGFAAWTQYFDHGVHGSKCAPTYAPFFAEAASIAAELCDPVPR